MDNRKTAWGCEEASRLPTDGKELGDREKESKSTHNREGTMTNTQRQNNKKEEKKKYGCGQMFRGLFMCWTGRCGQGWAHMS